MRKFVLTALAAAAVFAVCLTTTDRAEAHGWGHHMMWGQCWVSSFPIGLGHWEPCKKHHHHHCRHHRHHHHHHHGMHHRHHHH